MKCFKVNGVQLTAREVSLLEMGDVEDTNELRDVAALRSRMETATRARKIRLQMQIDSLHGTAECSSGPEASPVPV